MGKHNIKTRPIWKDLSYETKDLFERMQSPSNGEGISFPVSEDELVLILHFVEILAKARKSTFPEETWTTALRVSTFIALAAYQKAMQPQG